MYLNNGYHVSEVLEGYSLDGEEGQYLLKGLEEVSKESSSCDFAKEDEGNSFGEGNKEKGREELRELLGTTARDVMRHDRN